ncbi:RluA family pseudouridine synthase [Simkania sp.]|uniref:RluA family pseudouridine synthase n=1 Tax=Simkania sp. TaxID=34094 RepID=UPI003B52537A
MKSSVKEPIYLDNHVFVVNKPAGLPTQPRPTGGESLEGDAKAWIKRKFHKVGNVFLTPVHRLDLLVSGLVLFARTSKSLSRLQAQMRGRKIRKTYFARVEGRLKVKKGVLRHFITHGNRRAQIVSHDQGKEAVLSYRVVKEWKDQTLLEVELHTGRYHQIRAQLSFMGHPICGDVKYGAKTQKDRIDLHHGKLTFFHPISQEEITVKSPSPF